MPGTNLAPAVLGKRILFLRRTPQKSLELGATSSRGHEATCDDLSLP